MGSLAFQLFYAKSGGVSASVSLYRVTESTEWSLSLIHWEERDREVLVVGDETTMEVMRGNMMRSGLNPAAAPYVPASQRSVEDFSSEWWALVRCSPGFADYWLKECFEDYDVDAEDALPDDVDELFYPNAADPWDRKEEEGNKGGKRELVTWGAEKWKGSARGALAEAMRAAEKAPRIVNSAKVMPRTIQQPR